MCEVDVIETTCLKQLRGFSAAAVMGYRQHNDSLLAAVETACSVRKQIPREQLVELAKYFRPGEK